MSIIYNKVTANGTTLIDLSQDTVTSSDHIVSGYTGHLADGTQVVGTGGGSSTYTATIVHAGTSNYSYVTYNSTKYYTLNDTFTFNAGDACVIHGEGARADGQVYVDNVLVANDVLNYTYTLPSSDISIELDSEPTAGTYADAYIYTPTIPSGMLNIASNGTTVVRNYNKVIVNVPSSSPNLQNKTVSYTPTESAQSDTVSADSGYDGLDDVTVNVGAISSSYVGSEIARRSSTDVTIGNAQAEYWTSIPSGYYESAVTKYHTLATLTPSATKGTVSNHSITVTPSVTRTVGAVPNSGTTTGTAVTVSASELVSGSETKSSNGTYDVTNLASLVVSIPIVTYYTGSAAPSAALGTNGDIYLQT